MVQSVPASQTGYMQNRFTLFLILSGIRNRAPIQLLERHPDNPKKPNENILNKTQQNTVFQGRLEQSYILEDGSKTNPGYFKKNRTLQNILQTQKTK
jgi:hypothetical protein